jgi:hypothetical protein
MKRKLKRIISVVLTLLVFLSAVSAYTFAEPSGDDDVIIDIDIGSNIPESEFDNLWINDVFFVSLNSVAYEDGFTYRGTVFEYTIISGDCAELIEIYDIGYLVTAVKFSSSGQAAVKVKVDIILADSLGTEKSYTYEKIYNFTVTERPEDRPVKVKYNFPKLMKFKVGEVVLKNLVHVIFENLNYGHIEYDKMKIDFPTDEFSILYTGGAGGDWPKVSADRTHITNLFSEFGDTIIIKPGRYDFQAYYDGVSVCEPAVIEVEEPEIICNLPETVEVGATVDFMTELANTALENTDVARYENKDNYDYYESAGKVHWSWKNQKGFPVSYKPSVTVISGTDCVKQSEQNYSETLKSSEKLTFIKEGVVKLKISYKQIETYTDMLTSDIEKIVTVKVGNGDTLIIDSSEMFNDVDSDRWYKEYVDYVVTNNIFNGMSETDFEPNTAMTRAMFVQVLANLEGVDTENRDVDTVFSDVPSGKWYAPSVKWANENGIVDGVSKTTFEPNAGVTREQMCVLLVRFANYKGLTLNEAVAPKVFSDDANLSNYAKDAVYACQRAGIVSGMTETTFDPKGSATRAQVAKIYTVFHKDYIA